MLSGPLFIVTVDWMMSRAIEDGKRGIRWTPFSQLEDLQRMVEDDAEDSVTCGHFRPGMFISRSFPVM